MDHTLNRIEEIIEERIRPSLHAHGGDVEVLSYEDGILRIKLLGQCSGCPSAMVTNEELIGKEIMDELSEVKDVVLVQEVSEELMDMARKLLNHEKPEL